MRVASSASSVVPAASSAAPSPLRDALGRVVEDARFRYAYTPQGQLAEVTDKASGNVVARYRYNSAGQRVAKSVFDAEGRERVSFTLWQDGHRVAEIDGKGNLTAQTLYLAEGQHATPVAQLEGDRVLAVHADQRGAPVAMTDADQKIVWRANVSPWGAATPVNGKSFGPASLNLRLPGQYYDEETGLHDNGFRTYDPATGNYLQPDPLGYPDGPDAYRYAQGDPINRVDPDGLRAASPESVRLLGTDAGGVCSYRWQSSAWIGPDLYQKPRPLLPD